ncbi:MAG: hypothetical protein PWR17_1106 [Candidatus Methanomethylophilaceae archaeon]|nr:hypothetical protein [Candidatus Methanomethylophilaceae archaeon]
MADATADKKIAAAMKLMDDGDFKKAYSQFKKLTEEYPEDAECWYARAECGNYASGMFGAKIKPEEIATAYEKACELDPENVDYYQSYGLFCISVNKFDDAEKLYNEAAEMDESRAPSLYSEFAIEYYNIIMANYGEMPEDPKAAEAVNKALIPYKKKALSYMLKALEMSPEEAKSLL